MSKKYKKEFPRFFKKEVTKKELLRYIKYNYKIPLLPKKSPFNKLLYSLSREKLAALKEYLEDYLRKGYIKPSKSLTGVLVLLIKKPNGK